MGEKKMILFFKLFFFFLKKKKLILIPIINNCNKQLYQKQSFQNGNAWIFFTITLGTTRIKMVFPSLSEPPKKVKLV